MKVVLGITIKVLISLSFTLLILYFFIDYTNAYTKSESYSFNVKIDEQNSSFYLLPSDIASLYDFQVSSGHKGFDPLVPRQGVLQLENVDYHRLVLVEESRMMKKAYSFLYDKKSRGYILRERELPDFNVQQYFLYHILKSIGIFAVLFLFLIGVDLLFFKHNSKYLYPAIVFSGILSIVSIYLIVYAPLFTL